MNNKAADDEFKIKHIEETAQSQSTKVSFTFDTYTGIILLAIKCLKIWGNSLPLWVFEVLHMAHDINKTFLFLCVIIHVEYWTLKALVFLHYPPFQFEAFLL